MERLLEINERGTYVDPDQLSPDIPASKAQLLAQEEELFQTARLINCGWFGSVVFSDYFSCILGLVRGGNNWSLSPFGVGIILDSAFLLTDFFGRKSEKTIIRFSSGVKVTYAVLR